MTTERRLSCPAGISASLRASLAGAHTDLKLSIARAGRGVVLPFVRAAHFQEASTADGVTTDSKKPLFSSCLGHIAKPS